MPGPALPVVDAAALDPRAIDEACTAHGFFYVVGHGVDPQLSADLDRHARTFFALPDEEKAEIEMARGGRAWRGWFPVGGELTSGRPDQKEGIYFGRELPAGDEAGGGRAMHGPNLFPSRPPELGATVLAYMEEMESLGSRILRAMAVALGHDDDYFDVTLTRGDPVVLFRIFHYPPTPPDPATWGVGEHTDYGLLTLLAQDRHGGLQVRTPDGRSWIDAPPIEGAFVCNIGDMLERISGGRWRSTAHRVRNTSGAERLSFPFFLDPAWDAPIPGDADGRTYGDYLTDKVGRVFPHLARQAGWPGGA